MAGTAGVGRYAGVVSSGVGRKIICMPGVLCSGANDIKTVCVWLFVLISRQRSCRGLQDLARLQLSRSNHCECNTHRNFSSGITMKSYYGKCACGNAEYSITLPQDLSCYTPRACDCDFCTSRKVEYLSDSAGRIEIRSVLPLQRLKQGSNQATFLSCPTCATILGVAYITDKVSVGAVNATCGR